MHREKLINFMDYTAILLIGSLCFLDSFLGSAFAKININFDFLDFPIFIGELILAILMSLLILKFIYRKEKFDKFNYLMIGFFIFIFLKAILGFSKWGPLAFRNAALFYYSLFAVITYYFFNIDIFKKRAFLFVLLIFLIMICLFFMPRNYAFYSYFVLILILSYSCNYKPIKYLGYIMSLYFITMYCLLREGPRAFVISETLSLLFLVGALSFSFFREKLKTKRLISFVSILALIIFLVPVINLEIRERIKTLLNFSQLVQEYKLQRSYLNLPDVTNVEDYRVIQWGKRVKLYNEDDRLSSKELSKEISKVIPNKKLEGAVSEFTPQSEEKVNKILQIIDDINSNKKAEMLDDNLKKLSNAIADAKILITNVIAYNISEVYSKISEDKINSANYEIEKIRINLRDNDKVNKESSQKIQIITDELSLIVDEARKIIREKQPQPITSDRDIYSILWRLFVWQDMLDEMLKEKAFLGLDFGKPLRSASLERLRLVVGTGWGLGEWVGWIEPHNSYFHVIYRTGIMGIIFIVFLLSILIKITRYFIFHRSFVGIALSSGLLYYFLIANFIVFFELPQFIIPFWCLLGVTYAYYKQSLLCSGK